VVILISSSGNSPNVLEAARVAREKGATIIGMVGFEGGKLKDASDICLHVKTPKGEYGPIEDSHSMAMHLVTSYLTFWMREQAAKENPMPPMQTLKMA
jgi:D-sedoheptulose 7-phosphate isomerase